MTALICLSGAGTLYCLGLIKPHRKKRLIDMSSGTASAEAGDVGTQCGVDNKPWDLHDIVL